MMQSGMAAAAAAAAASTPMTSPVSEFKTMSSLGEVQRIIGLSLSKIQLGRNQRGGLPLHKNLLVATVLNKARDLYMQETMYMNYKMMTGQFMGPAAAMNGMHGHGMMMHAGNGGSVEDMEAGHGGNGGLHGLHGQHGQMQQQQQSPSQEDYDEDCEDEESDAEEDTGASCAAVSDCDAVTASKTGASSEGESATAALTNAAAAATADYDGANSGTSSASAGASSSSCLTPLTPVSACEMQQEQQQQHQQQAAAAVMFQHHQQLLQHHQLMMQQQFMQQQQQMQMAAAVHQQHQVQQQQQMQQQQPHGGVPANSSSSDEGFIDEPDCDCDARNNFGNDSGNGAGGLNRVPPFQYCYNCAPFHSTGRGPTLVPSPPSPAAVSRSPTPCSSNERDLAGSAGTDAGGSNFTLYDMDAQATTENKFPASSEDAPASRCSSPLKRRRNVSDEASGEEADSDELEAKKRRDSDTTSEGEEDEEVGGVKESSPETSLNESGFESLPTSPNQQVRIKPYTPCFGFALATFRDKVLVLSPLITISCPISRRFIRPSAACRHLHRRAQLLLPRPPPARRHPGRAAGRRADRPHSDPGHTPPAPATEAARCQVEDKTE